MRYHEMWRQLLIKIERNSLLQLCNISNFNKNDIIFHLQQFFLFDIEIKCWKTILGSSPTNEHASLKLMHFKSEKLQSKLWISFSKLFTYVIQIKILDVLASFELIEKNGFDWQVSAINISFRVLLSTVEFACCDHGWGYHSVNIIIFSKISIVH